MNQDQTSVRFLKIHSNAAAILGCRRFPAHDPGLWLLVGYLSDPNSTMDARRSLYKPVLQLHGILLRLSIRFVAYLAYLASCCLAFRLVLSNFYLILFLLFRCTVFPPILVFQSPGVILRRTRTSKFPPQLRQTNVISSTPRLCPSRELGRRLFHNSPPGALFLHKLKLNQTRWIQSDFTFSPSF